MPGSERIMEILSASAGSITDVPGVRVGHESDFAARTGVTVALFEHGAMGAGLLLGGAASTRGFESLHPRGIAKPVHGVCFAGGSSYGLTATGGVQRYLRERGQGLHYGERVIPLVPSAIIFDLYAGRGDILPTEDMAYRACAGAGTVVAEGNVGAATGALVGKILREPQAMAGGIGTASARVGEATIGVLAVVNAFGDVRDPSTGRVIAGARTAPDALALLDTAAALRSGLMDERAVSTTLVLVVTDAALDAIDCGMAAQMASAGFARAIAPIFTQYDGDVIIMLSAGQKTLHPLVAGQVAAELTARAIVRGVLAAGPVNGLPCAADLVRAGVIDVPVV